MKLSLHYPMQQHIVNQRFGENNPCVRDFGLASQNIVSTFENSPCPAGYEKLYGKFGLSGHNGIDLWALDETPVYASLEGVVEELSTEPERGLGVGVISCMAYDLESLGTHNLKIRYWHLKSIVVSKNQTIRVGDLLGLADNTGYSSGSHLHQEGKAVDRDGSGWINTYQTNGYYGAIDIEPYYNGSFADKAWRHLFLYDMTIGQSGSEIKALQRILKIDGVFPSQIDETGFYGEITRQSVERFQKRYGVASFSELLFVRGRRVGEKTRKKLNELYGSL